MKSKFMLLRNADKLFCVKWKSVMVSMTCLVCSYASAQIVSDTSQNLSSRRTEETKGYYGWSPVIIDKMNRADRAVDSTGAGLSDSVKAEFMQYVGKQFGATRLNQIKSGMKIQEQTGKLPGYLEGKLRGFYAKAAGDGFSIPAFTNFFDPQPGEARLETMFIDPSSQNQQITYRISANNIIQIMDIPFAIQLGYMNVGNRASSGNTLFKVGFDKEKYSSALKNKMNKSYDLKKYFLNDIDVSNYAKKYFEDQVKKVTTEVQETASSNFYNKVTDKVTTEELIHLTDQQIEEKIFPISYQKLLNEKIHLNQTRLNDTSGMINTFLRDSLQREMNESINERNAYEKFFNKLATLKTSLKKEGFDMNKFIRLQQSSNAGVDRVLNNGDVFRESASNLMPLNGIQKLFLKLKTFNVGNLDAAMSDKSVSSMFMNGFNLSSLNNDKFLALGAGSNRDGGYIKDGVMQNSLKASTALQFIRFGKGDMSGKHTHLSIINGQTLQTQLNNFSVVALPRNMVAGTISKNMSVGHGQIEAELSKSSTQFRNTVNINNLDQVAQRKSAISSMGEDLWQTMSVKVGYTDHWETIGLSNKIVIDYGGLGYNNPGAVSSSRGAVRYGVQLKKELLSKKAFIQLRSDNRSINYSVDGSGKWNNTQWHLDGRYKISRSANVGFKLMQYQMVRITESSKSKMYFSNKLTLESQNTYTFKGIRQRTNISVGMQQFRTNYAATGSVSKMTLTTIVHTLPVSKTNWLTGTLFYNKELEGQQLIGDLLNTDISLSYPLNKQISLSSALTYLDNKSQARQLGTRQTISASLFNGLLVNMFVDYRKDLITSFNTYMFPVFRGEVGAVYQF